jgi:hypothetical protein
VDLAPDRKTIDRESSIRRAHGVAIDYYEYRNIEPYRLMALRQAQVFLLRQGYKKLLRENVCHVYGHRSSFPWAMSFSFGPLFAARGPWVSFW